MEARTRHAVVSLILLLGLATASACNQKAEDDINVHLIALTSILEEGRQNPNQAVRDYQQYISDNGEDLELAISRYEGAAESMGQVDYLSKYQPVFRRYEAIYDAFITDFPATDNKIRKITDELTIP